MSDEITRSILQIIFLTLIFSLESFFPLFQMHVDRFRHGLRNLALGILNSVIIFLLFSAVTVLVIGWTKENNAGLLNQFHLPGILKLIFAFVLFDFWMYLWHIANHEVAFFWRFHRVHHSDLAMDSTTALRFHTGEIVLSSLARLLVIPLLGIDFFHLFIYELCLQPVILLHHSNVALPEKWDKILRSLIVTPNMHRIHHSQIREETNSTYASIFSLWDRIGKTFRKREEGRIVHYGLSEYLEPYWQSFKGMLKMPFIPTQSALTREDVVRVKDESNYK